MDRTTTMCLYGERYKLEVSISSPLLPALPDKQHYTLVRDV